MTLILYKCVEGSLNDRCSLRIPAAKLTVPIGKLKSNEWVVISYGQILEDLKCFLAFLTVWFVPHGRANLEDVLGAILLG